MLRQVLRTFALALIAITLTLLIVYGVNVVELRHANRFVLEAYREHRTMELRIRGAAHGPLVAPRGSHVVENNPSSSLIRAEASLVGLRPSERESTEVRTIWGRVFLLQGGYEAAIGAFQQAMEKGPVSADLLDDLASAYFQRARHFENSDARGHTSGGEGLNLLFSDYGEAYELQSRALDKDPTDETALFNRAVTAEHLYLFRQATDDWAHYLNIDSSSEWSGEARQRLALLQELLQAHKREFESHLLTAEDFGWRPGSDQYQTLRDIEPRIEQYLDVATVTWLPAAFSMRSPKGEAETTRKSLRALDLILREEHHDEWLSDMLAQRNDAEYSAAVEQLSTAVRANEDEHHALALSSATQAEQLFGNAGNEAGQLRARFEKLYALRFADQAADCLKASQSDASFTDGNRYPWATAQLELEEAICAIQQNQFDRGARLEEDAYQRSKDAHYEGLSLRALSLLGQLAAEEGRRREAWELADEGLSRYWSHPLPPRRGYNFYFLLEQASTGEQQWHLQIALDRECLELLDSMKLPLLRAEMNIHLAHAALMTGQAQLAERSEAAAQENLSHVDSDRAKRAYLAGIQIALAQADVHHKWCGTRLGAGEYVVALVSSVGQRHQLALNALQLIGNGGLVASGERATAGLDAEAEGLLQRGGDRTQRRTGGRELALNHAETLQIAAGESSLIVVLD